MCVPIHSIGDHLVAKVIEEAGDKFWKHCCPAGKANGSLPKVGSGKLEARPHVELAPYGTARFDSESKVDVCVKHGNIIIGCEVKLGDKRLELTDLKRYATPCEGQKGNLELWKGKMIAVLARRFQENTSGVLKVKWGREGKLMPLSKDWILIAREQVVKKLKAQLEGQHPEELRGMMLVSFEALACEITDKKFNELACQFFPSNPYQEWVVRPMNAQREGPNTKSRVGASSGSK